MELSFFLKTKGLEACEEKLLRFMESSLQWNEMINLTAVREPSDFIDRNLIDSLTLVGRPELSGASRVLDLGTGGGLPGIPLAIACPDKEFVLADSVGKKLTVVAAIARELELDNVITVHGRAEDLARDAAYRDGFDLVVSRAVAALPVLSEYCLPFVKKGGFFVAYKTENSTFELDDAKGALEKLGASAPEKLGAGLENSGHIFVIIKKLQPTAAAYPRKAGTPVREPLR